MREHEQKKVDGTPTTTGPSGDAPDMYPIAGPMLQRKLSQRVIQRKEKAEAGKADPEEKVSPVGAGDRQKTYAAAGAQHAYNVDGRDVLVFLPEHFNPPDVDVFVFFHGLYADYTGKKGENGAVASQLQEAVAASGKVGLAPVGGTGANWKMNPGGFKQMVDGALQQLSAGMGQPLRAGHISLAGHSAGGTALGQAALEMDDSASEVTLQDAGYGKFADDAGVLREAANYLQSWGKLRDWFLTGKPEKTLRVITRNAKGSGQQSASTRYVIEDAERGFNEAALNKYIQTLQKAGKLQQPLTVTARGGNRSPRAAGMVLEEQLSVDRADGHQGTIYVFSTSGSVGHMDVRNRTMAAAAQGGDEDFGKLDLKPGPYLVTDADARVREEKDLSKPKRDEHRKIYTMKQGSQVQVVDYRVGPDGQIYAHAEAVGWTLLSNLRSLAVEKPPEGPGAVTPAGA